MPFLAAIARWEAAVIVVGSGFIIAWNIVGGRIRLSGVFLRDHANGEAYFTLGRVQFLAVLGIAGQPMVRFCLNPIKFPDLPDTSIVLTTGCWRASILELQSGNQFLGWQRQLERLCAWVVLLGGARPAGIWRLVESTL